MTCDIPVNYPARLTFCEQVLTALKSHEFWPLCSGWLIYFSLAVNFLRTCGQTQTGLLQKAEELDHLQGLEAWLSLEDSLNELSALDALVELFLVWLYIPASKIGAD